ncbi:sister chromatid cohesion protein PDS5 homolog C-like isoform X2 [Humulus lupulus]|uniref:sister chromatid cohesion protein PDS5 homolog C-like isoform X2 n=1 Tax=Humulus lupulus TaxID=3486 RepID=UPI002B40A858|nr:sister chromatid cohesion protein PDS5 homolog C-like isoform X2 [Humulus lupulus]
MPPSPDVIREKLKDAGTSLLHPPSSTDELLTLLDRTENLLTNVPQTPSTSIENVLLPAMKALISDELLKHSDLDVKISVVSCITEITRITAPDAPYNDEQMKEIFQLTVAAFESLSLESGRCYTKALNILDVVSKVRSSLVMLDLQCDALVCKMFQLFFKHIRSNHPPAVFSSMEFIMTLVIKESEEISLDLITLLLSSVKKEKQDKSPASSKLGEKVLTICASTLKPFLKKAVRSMGIDLNDYAQIVASICSKIKMDYKHKAVKESGNTSGTNGLVQDVVCMENDGHQREGILFTPMPFPKNKKNNSFKKLQRIKHPERADSRNVSEPGSIREKRIQKPKSLMSAVKDNSKGADSRGTAEPSSSLSIKTEKHESEPDSALKSRGQMRNSLKNPKEDHPRRTESRDTAKGESSLLDKADKTGSDPDNAPKKRDQKLNSLMDAENAPLERENSINTLTEEKTETDFLMKSTKAEKSESEPDSATKKRGRKPNSLMKSEEGYNNSWMSSGKKILRSSRLRNTDDQKSIESLPSKNSVSKKRTSTTTDNVKELAPKLDENIRENIASYQRGRGKRKMSTLNQEVDTKSLSDIKSELDGSQVEEKLPESVNLNLKKEPEDIGCLEEKDQGNSTKLGLAAKENKESAVASEHVFANKKTEGRRQPKEKLQEQSTVKSEAADVNDNLSALRTTKKRKRAGNSSNNNTNEESGLKGLGSNTGIKISSGNGSYSAKSSETIFKRKRVIGKEQASETPILGELVIGTRIKVWWPLDKTFYEGVVESYDPVKKKHQVSYVDGDRETLNLKNQRWELVVNDALAEEGKKTDLPGPNSSPQINSQKEKQTTELDQEKEAKAPVQVKQEQADVLSNESNPKVRPRARSVNGKQVKKSDRAKAGSSSGRNSGRKVLNTKTNSNKEKQAKKSDQPKVDPSPESKPQTRAQKRTLEQLNQASNSDQGKPDSPLATLVYPRKRMRKNKLDQGKQPKGTQSKADSSTKRTEMSNTESADAAPVDNPAITDEPMDTTKTDEKLNTKTTSDTKSAVEPVDEKVKDNGCNSDAVDTLKSTSEGTQITQETVALTKKKNPEVDNDIGGEENQWSEQSVNEVRE